MVKGFLKSGTLALMAGALVLAGCGGSGSSSGSGGSSSSSSSSSTSSSSTAAKPTVKIAYQSTFWAAPFIVGVSQNVWKGQPINVQNRVLGSGAAVRNAIISGSADIGDAGTTPFIVGAAKGSLVAIGAVAYAGNTLAVVALKGGGITKVSQLKGKKIASRVGSSTNEILTSEVLPAFGLKSGDYQIVNTSFQSQVAALASHSVDAFAGVSPYPQIAVADGVGTILTTFGKYDMAPLLLVTRKSYLQQHPKAVKAFLAGWQKAVAYYNNNPDQTAQIIKSNFSNAGWKASTATVKNALAAMTVKGTYVSGLKAYLTKQAQYLKSTGKIKAIPDWNKVLLSP